MAIIEVVDLVKTYKNGLKPKTVLKNINLKIEQGSFTAIIGPSGSGKTTLLYTMSGLETIDSGDVSILGQSIVNKSTANLSDLRKNHIGFVFQFYHLIPSLTVYENLLLRDVVSDKKGFTIEKALEAVGLTEDSHKYPHMISGGQQQRVSIARAILNQPDILFADEPTGNLDLQSSIEIMDLLKTLNRDYHITILLVTHNDQLLTYANRTITLLDGQVMQDENA